MDGDYAILDAWKTNGVKICLYMKPAPGARPAQTILSARTGQVLARAGIIQGNSARSCLSYRGLPQLGQTLSDFRRT